MVSKVAAPIQISISVYKLPFLHTFTKCFFYEISDSEWSKLHLLDTFAFLQQLMLFSDGQTFTGHLHVFLSKTIQINLPYFY